MTITSETEYQAALARVDALWDTATSPEEEAEFERLVDEIEAYEDEHYPIDEPSPEAMAEFRREQEGKA